MPPLAIATTPVTFPAVAAVFALVALATVPVTFPPPIVAVVMLPVTFAPLIEFICASVTQPAHVAESASAVAALIARLEKGVEVISCRGVKTVEPTCISKYLAPEVLNAAAPKSSLTVNILLTTDTSELISVVLFGI